MASIEEKDDKSGVSAPLQTFTTAQTAVASSGQFAKASDLTGALANGSTPSRLIVTVSKDEKNPNIVVLKTTLLGTWTGPWIKGAIRSVEREYKSIKHNTMRKAAAERSLLASKQQPIVSKKGVGDV